MDSPHTKRMSAMLLLLMSLLTGCAQGGDVRPTPHSAPLALNNVSVETPDNSIADTQQPQEATDAAESEATDSGTMKKEYERHGFVSVGDELPTVLLDVRYYSAYNFVGKRIDGYNAPVVLLTKEAANALAATADDLMQQGYVFKIFDGYRPQRAVDCFVRWASDENDQRYQAVFYPDIDKSRLLHGYIAKKSGHTRGSTVDLTIVEIKTGKEVDMGTPFDFLSEKSNHGSKAITDAQTRNRDILKDAMVRHGFKPYSAEWWHYTLIDEPYPDTYFDFVVE